MVFKLCTCLFFFFDNFFFDRTTLFLGTKRFGVVGIFGKIVEGHTGTWANCTINGIYVG